MVDEKVKESLNRMSDLALSRSKETYLYDKGGVKRYIRLNSNGYRVVSLDTENPCGKLITEDGKDVPERTDLNDALKDLKDTGLVNHKLSEDKNKDKPEHRLQAQIIYTALTDKDGTYLPKYLGCDKCFDRLLFVDDEFSIENIRADLIFLGIKDGCIFPVFIELKVKRLATELRKQLNNIQSRLKQYDKEFVKFTASVTGENEKDILFKNSKRIAIWPEGGKNRRKENNLNDDDSDILILGYKERYAFVIED